MQAPTIQSFFDTDTSTVTHVVSDPATGRAAIIDSVLDYDPKSGRTSHASADKVMAYVEQAGLKVDWLLETHAHADHLSAAPYLREKLGGQIAIGRHICEVQEVFKKIFNAGDMDTEGADFDHLFDDGETFKIGQVEVRVMHTPGHTPACLTYRIGQDAFVGDTLFTPEPRHTAVPGFTYGGLIASLIDCHSTDTAAAAMYRAKGREMDTLPAFRFVTGSLKVDFLKPTPLAGPLELRGRVKEIKGRKVIVETTVWVDGIGTARGDVVAVQMPEHFGA